MEFFCSATIDPGAPEMTCPTAATPNLRCQHPVECRGCPSPLDIPSRITPGLAIPVRRPSNLLIQQVACTHELFVPAFVPVAGSKRCLHNIFMAYTFGDNDNGKSFFPASYRALRFPADSIHGKRHFGDRDSHLPLLRSRHTQRSDRCGVPSLRRP